MGTNKARLFSVGSTALLAGVLLGCGSKQNQLPGQLTKPVVICVTAGTQEVTDFDDFVGRTEPSETVDVQARVNGFLQTVDFVDGQLVSAGDVLATIEPDEYKAIHQQSLANIELWQSKLALAQTSFERFKELRKNNSVSQAEYDESEAAVQEAQSQITAANAAAARTELDVKYTNILAPISGRADRTLVTPGNVVTGGLGAGTLITRIVNDTPIFAYIDVDEQSVLHYKRLAREKGTNNSPDGALKDLSIPCFLKLQDEDEFEHEGVLDFIENQVDSGTGTIKLRGVFENTDHFLQGGLFVRVRIPKGKPYKSTLIPEQCIATDQADRIAYVVNDKNEVEIRVLELGSRIGTMRSIRKGIRAGEKVVYQGIQKVRPGMEVQAAIKELPSQDLDSGNTPPARTPAEPQPASDDSTSDNDGSESQAESAAQ